ncbi:MAG: hypothetical protein EBX39_06370, partial [Actinobacteria bacterium]|nr:hypothetical protein [Actinomycetota bacterium]
MAGALDGIRIIDCSIALTGPYPAALLGDQGAEVIKVERPGLGDIARWVGVAVNGVSSLFQSCNRGKRSIAVDITTEEGSEIVRAMAAEADVFIQNFRPGALDRAGLGYEALSADHPELIYVSLSGFGDVGPYAHKGAYDTVIQAYAGLATNQADPDVGDPVFLRQTAADKITGLYAVQAITAALLARERGAGGQHIKLSMTDAVVSPSASSLLTVTLPAFCVVVSLSRTSLPVSLVRMIASALAFSAAVTPVLELCSLMAARAEFR